ncbi:MAG: translesion DNA synthesis-associated protein ImuA [Gammaproteobacteria bacterium]
MSLEAILSDPRVWRLGHESPVASPTIPTGFAELDALLPGGGWPLGALTEILTNVEGIGALRLILPALADLHQSEKWLVWIAPPHIPYAPALAANGVALANVLIVMGIRSPQACFWALEQSLRAGVCSAVLAWPPHIDWRGLRRLQLAAEVGQSLGVVFRPMAARRETSPAALRLLLEPSGSFTAVQIIKRRGGAGVKPIYLDLQALLR